MNKTKGGFTLLELLAVLIIVTILVQVATPIFGDLIKGSRDFNIKSQIYSILDSAASNAKVNLKKTKLNFSSDKIDLILMKKRITADVTYVSGAGSVTVNGTVFTYDAGSNSGQLFTTVNDLLNDIDSLSSADATITDATHIKVTAVPEDSELTLGTTGGYLVTAPAVNWVDEKKLETVYLEKTISVQANQEVIFDINGFAESQKVIDFKMGADNIRLSIYQDGRNTLQNF